jgi:hypothetical protein
MQDESAENTQSERAKYAKVNRGHNGYVCHQRREFRVLSAYVHAQLATLEFPVVEEFDSSAKEAQPPHQIGQMRALQLSIREDPFIFIP